MRHYPHDRHRAQRDYWAQRHTDPGVAEQYEERFGDTRQQQDAANLKTIARLAAMTPEERAANDAAALRDMGEYLCPKHLQGERREKWIELRTAHIHALREAGKQAEQLHAGAAGKPVFEDEAEWGRDVVERAHAADSMAGLAALRAEVFRHCRRHQLSLPAIHRALCVVLDVAHAFGKRAIEDMSPEPPPAKTPAKPRSLPVAPPVIAAPVSSLAAPMIIEPPATEPGYLFPAAALAAAKASSVQHMLF